MSLSTALYPELYSLPILRFGQMYRGDQKVTVGVQSQSPEMCFHGVQIILS